MSDTPPTQALANTATSNPLRMTLRKILEAVIRTAKDTSSPFVSQTIIDSFATEDNIRSVLQQESNFIATYDPGELDGEVKSIHTEAPKFFTLMLCSNILIDSLVNLRQKGVTDNNLPLTPKDCEHLEERATFDDNGEFLPQQKYFTAMLEEGRYDLEVPEAFPSPFRTGLSQGVQIGVGHNGKVRNIPATNRCFDFRRPSTEQRFALKIIESWNEEAAQCEQAFLENMKNHEHEHIANSYTAFWHRGSYHIISELAAGDVDQLLTEARQWTPSLQWLLQQMHGLASALQTIHNRPSNDECFGVHGDIKENNILAYFRYGQKAPPHLCLADWDCYDYVTDPNKLCYIEKDQTEDIRAMGRLYATLLLRFRPDRGDLDQTSGGKSEAFVPSNAPKLV
jgi:hypothetical protein